MRCGRAGRVAGAARAPRLAGRPAGFHGEAGARAPAVYAVSHVERYLECPFKYFASSRARAPGGTRRGIAGLGPQERGQFLHEVFQQFFAAGRQQAGQLSITAETEEAALALFEQVVEAAWRRSRNRIGRWSGRTCSDLRRHRAGGRAFAFEIEQGAAVVERLLEHVLEGAVRVRRAKPARGR